MCLFDNPWWYGLRYTVNRKYNSGFTLFEALIVVALIGLFTAFGIPLLLQMLQSYYVKSASTQLAIHMRFARNESISRKIDYRVIVRSNTHSTAPNTYQVENDTDQDGTFEKVANLDIHLTRGITINDTAVFSGGQATINFNTRGGATASSGSPPYDFEVESPNGQIYRVRLFLTGAVQIDKT